MLRYALLFMVLSLAACHKKRVVQAEPPDLPLWDVEKGDEWVYRVRSSYLAGSEPRFFPGDVRFEKNGRLDLEFERRKIADGRLIVKKGKGLWDVFRVVRGGTTEEYEYLEVTPDRISFWGSQGSGGDSTKVKSLSVPLDLVRKGLEGGEHWEYQLGENPKNVRSFRAAGVEEIVVPAGSFEARKFMAEGRSRDMEVKEVYWFHPKHGFLKFEKSFYTQTALFKREVMELISGPSRTASF